MARKTLPAPAEPATAPDADAPTALRLAGLSKRYGAVTALDAIDLQVPKGEFVTLLGPSGCGKSTVLKLVAGFVMPSDGQIVIDGRDVSRRKPRDRGVGMVFQDYALFPHLTAAENIEYGLKMRRWKRADRVERAAQLLRSIGLEGLGDRRPNRLSGGQQQRVAMARALAWNPSIMLMDEPLSALDREMRVMMAEQLREIHDALGATTVLVTHDRDEAMRLADQVGVLRDGRIDCVATPKRLYEDPPTAFSASFFGAHNLLAATLREWDAGVGAAVVEVAGETMRVPRATPEQPVAAPAPAAGGPVTVSVPRDAVTLVAEGGIRCEVRHVTYLGDIHQITAVCAGQTVHVEVPASGDPLPVGEAGLVIDEARARVHAGAAAAPEEPAS